MRIQRALEDQHDVRDRRALPVVELVVAVMGVLKAGATFSVIGPFMFSRALR